MESTMKTSIIRRSLIQKAIASLSVCLVGLTALPVLAQSWPNKPVRMVVSCACRQFLRRHCASHGRHTQSRLGQSLVVENKPGAGGTIGMDLVAKAAPDGYTLGIGFNGPIAFGPFMFKKMPYDPAQRFDSYRPDFISA
jgi:tripartite-type tricarboxylate transporter receptor subunit TctC